MPLQKGSPIGERLLGRRLGEFPEVLGLCQAAVRRMFASPLMLPCPDALINEAVLHASVKESRF